MYVYMRMCMCVCVCVCVCVLYMLCSFRKQIMDMSTATIEEQSEAVLEFYNVCV